MINTVLQAIERFESSASFEEVNLPTAIFDAVDETDIINSTDTEEETSEDTDEYKDTREQNSPGVVKYQQDQAQIKQTLKDKIRIRRESEGAEEITTLFEPPKQYELTPEEELKNEIRKQRNRRSATKSRLKRIAREKKLEEDAEALEKEHAKRTREVNSLKKIKLIFETILQRHQKSCPIAVKARYTATLPPNTDLNADVALSTTGHTERATSGFCVQSQLPRSVEPQIRQQINQFEQFQQPMKRKATEQSNEQPFKIPTTWNAGEMATLSLNPYSTGVQTGTNNSFSEMRSINTITTTSEIDTSNAVQTVSMTTRVDIQRNSMKENITCEMPSSNENIEPPFSSPMRNNSLGVLTDSAGTSSGVDNQLFMESEQEKINKIKQHLLDDFHLQPVQ